MRRKSNSQQAKEACEKWIKGHRLSEKVSKSWFLQRPEGGSCYSFTVTWTRGVLTLSGDIEDLTITHYYAMPTWVDAVLWADGADPQYLLEKSGRQRSYDKEATFHSIIDYVNEEAVADMKYHRDEMRLWYEEMRCANSTDPLQWDGGDEVGPVWFGRPEAPGLEKRWKNSLLSTRYHEMVVPEAWQAWDRLREAVDSLADQEEIFTKQGRDRIKYELEEELSKGDAEAHQIIGKVMGWDDASPCYDYTFHQYLSARAVVQWAAVVKETDEFKQAHARMVANVELADQVFAMDRRMPYHKYDNPRYCYLPGVIPMVNHG